MISCCLDLSIRDWIYYYDYETKEVVFNKPVFCTISLCDDLEALKRGVFGVEEICGIAEIGIMRFEDDKIVFYTGYLKDVPELRHEFPVQLDSYEVIVTKDLEEEDSIVITLNTFNVKMKIIYNPKTGGYRTAYPGMK